MRHLQVLRKSNHNHIQSVHTLHFIVPFFQAYFVEEQNEVDSKGNKKCQKAEVVEVSGQVILWKIIPV